MKNLFFLLWVVVFSIGCSKKSAESLRDTAENFTKALYRKDANALLSTISPDKQALFYENFRKIDSLHISTADLDQLLPTEEGKSAIMSLKLVTYRPENLGMTEDLRFYPLKYEKELERWFVDVSDPLGKTSVESIPGNKKGG